MISRIDNIIFILFIALSVISCSPSENERLEKEVLDIHDEVMPWLDDMKLLRRKLLKSPFDNKADSSKADEAAIALHRADSFMWAWMYQYKPVNKVRDSMTDAQLNDYLIHQREYIAHVNTSMKNAVKRANEILKKN